jgi:hypothetical protein
VLPLSWSLTPTPTPKTEDAAANAEDASSVDDDLSAACSSPVFIMIVVAVTIISSLY